MLFTPKKPLSGRTTLATLAVLAIALVGLFLFSRRADAQGSQARRDTTFAPVYLNDILASGNLELQPTMFLPAVPNATTPFRVQVLWNGGELTLPIPQAGQESVFMAIYMEFNPKTGVEHLVLESSTGDTRRADLPASSDLLTVRILPAVQSNGNEASPLSSAMLVYGTEGDAAGDLLPYQFSMPPNG